MAAEAVAMTAPPPTREEIADTLERYIGSYLHPAASKRALLLAVADALLARLRPAFERLERLEAYDKADPYETRRQLAMRIDAIRADLEAAHKEIDALGYARHDFTLAERLNLVLSEPDFDPDREVAALKASLARKDEALRACVEALTSIVTILPEDGANGIYVDRTYVEKIRAALARAQEAER